MAFLQKIEMELSVQFYSNVQLLGIRGPQLIAALVVVINLLCSK